MCVDCKMCLYLGHCFQCYEGGLCAGVMYCVHILGCPSSDVNVFDGVYLLCQRFQITFNFATR